MAETQEVALPGESPLSGTRSTMKSSVVTIEDTAKFVSILPKLLNAGVKEAGFPPINDD